MKVLIPIFALALLPAAALAQADCGEDVFAADASGATVRLTHANAHYNCCSTIAFDVASSPGGYAVTEHEIEPVCDCSCCFTLAARIDDVPPGERTITLRFYDYDSGGWRELTAVVTVPDVGQGGGGSLVSTWKSACGGTTGVSDPPATGWGALKLRYR